MPPGAAAPRRSCGGTPRRPTARNRRRAWPTINSLPRDRWFVDAVVDEARREFGAAEGNYRDIAARYPDEAAPLIELAGFLDRRGRTADAIVTYQQALAVDDSAARAEVELCRLYNRSNEGANARDRAQRAVAKYQALGSLPGKAQALFCLADTLRTGGDQDREQARAKRRRSADDS